MQKKKTGLNVSKLLLDTCQNFFLQPTNGIFFQQYKVQWFAGNELMMILSTRLKHA